MTTTHTYASQYPSGIQVNAGIKAFFEDFYRISDNSSKLEEWLACFTADADVAIGIKKAKGLDGG
jgi:hypothetical protein